MGKGGGSGVQDGEHMSAKRFISFIDILVSTPKQKAIRKGASSTGSLLQEGAICKPPWVLLFFRMLCLLASGSVRMRRPWFWPTVEGGRLTLLLSSTHAKGGGDHNDFSCGSTPPPQKAAQMGKEEEAMWLWYSARRSWFLKRKKKRVEPLFSPWLLTLQNTGSGAGSDPWSLMHVWFTDCCVSAPDGLELMNTNSSLLLTREMCSSIWFVLSN